MFEKFKDWLYKASIFVVYFTETIFLVLVLLFGAMVLVHNVQ